MAKIPKNKDFAYAMTPFKILSWPVGTWPLQTYNVFSFIRFVLTISVLLLMQLIINTELCINSSNAETNLDSLLMIVCGNLALSKVMSFRVYSTQLVLNFISAVKDYNNLNDEKKRAIMRRHAYMGRVTLIGVMIISNLSIGILTMLPILIKSEQDMNVSIENTMKFPIPSERIILLLKLPEDLYSMVFLTEYTMLVLVNVGNLGSDLLFFGIVFHLCGQAEVLKMQFNKLVDDNDKTTENFHLLMKRHCYLLTLSKMLNEVISSVLAVQLLASCVLICTCGFQFILALNNQNITLVVKAFVILSTLMIQLFLYSYVGDYLNSQMDGIGYSLYSCKWYSLPTNVVKNIIFVILKAQVPVYLTAGNFFVVNLESFMSIVKTSMSYLSVLRVMINT